MKKIIITLLTVFAVCTSISAQRKVVYLEPFTSNTGADPALLGDIRARVYDRLAELGRVTIVDGHNYGEDKASAVGADYILRGVVGQAAEGFFVNKKDGKEYYEVSFDGIMQLVEVATGNVVGEKSLSGDNSQVVPLPDMSPQDSRYRLASRKLEDEAAGRAYQNAVSSCGGLIEMLIDENIKIKVQITGVTDVKGSKVREVVINKGSFSGVSLGERFVVSTRSMIGGYEKVTEIAEIRVNNQPAEHSASCKVSKGGELLKAALENNEELTVISRTAKLFD